MTDIQRICETYGITQTKLSQSFNIPLRTVQAWHAGDRTPPPYVVAMLEQLLKLSLKAD